jgi:GT2 family glycosyltransferase
MPSRNYSVSIVIPNYNGVSLLKKHLPSVLVAAPDAQIIVVDDASTDDSILFLHQNFPQIKVCAHKTNQRFAAACNTGVKEATGDIVILLNNDVSPHKDFLSALVYPFNDDKVFAVGCAEISDSKINGRAGGEFRRGLSVHWRCKDQSQKSTLWVSGGSGAFRKSLWENLRGMDTLFAPAYEEDRDICYRALKRGYKVVFAPSSIVDHIHETTNQNELGVDRMKVASYKNHLLFVWKNITDPHLFLAHLLWLPYHLFFTTIRSGGYFGLGLIAALKQLPEVIKKRQIEKRESTISDVEVFASIKE